VCVWWGGPLWSSGLSSSLQIQRPGFDSRCYKIFWEVVGLELDLLSCVSTTEELLGRKSSGSGLESQEYGRRDPSRWPRGNLYPQKFAITSLTSGRLSVGIVRLRSQATGFSLVYIYMRVYIHARARACVRVRACMRVCVCVCVCACVWNIMPKP
jgi:hypothetical protein